MFVSVDIHISSNHLKLGRKTTSNLWIHMKTWMHTCCWLHPWNFQVIFFGVQANEDCNCYSYDARKLNEAKCVHRDHVSAVYVTWSKAFKLNISIVPTMLFDLYMLNVSPIMMFFRMAVDYSPTGREFVTGSYDRTVSSFCSRSDVLMFTIINHMKNIAVLSVLLK